MLRTIALKILPIGVWRALRQWLLGGPELNISYEVISAWPPPNPQFSWSTSAVTGRFKEGLETFNLETARQSPEAALQSPIVRDSLATLLKTGLTTATLLDFGCGNGLYRSILLADPLTKFWTYVGIEVNPELVEFCRIIYPDTPFEVMKERQQLPFPDDKFDIVLASGVVHYIQDFTPILLELGRVSKKWVLINRLPLYKYQASQIILQRVYHNGEEEQHPMHILNRPEFETLLAKLGFSVVFHNYGSEFFYVPGVAEMVVHNTYLLQVER